jgi:hypothetical protein
MRGADSHFGCRPGGEVDRASTQLLTPSPLTKCPSDPVDRVTSEDESVHTDGELGETATPRRHDIGCLMTGGQGRQHEFRVGVPLSASGRKLGRGLESGLERF